MWTETTPRLHVATMAAAPAGRLDSWEWRSRAGQCSVRYDGGAWHPVELHHDHRNARWWTRCPRCWLPSVSLYWPGGTWRQGCCRRCCGLHAAWSDVLEGGDVRQYRIAARSGRARDVIEVAAGGGTAGLRARVALEDVGLLPRRLRPDHGQHRLAVDLAEQSRQFVAAPSTSATIYTGPYCEDASGEYEGDDQERSRRRRK